MKALFGYALPSLLLSQLCRTALTADGGSCGAGDEPSGALYLTPLIEAGRLGEARNLSRTGHIGGSTLQQVDSYSGYITVNKTFDSNLFFWFFPALERESEAPVLVWLQGGPGASSLLGAFAENGPYALTNTDPPVAVRRPSNWVQRFSMIYVDEPVGTGFSFTRSDLGYVRNLTELGRDMVEFLQQFFTLFADYAERDFYVAGESFGGKFVPATAFAIHEAYGSLRVKINLKGIAFGNGVTDPPNMIDYGDHFFQLGLVDEKQAAHFNQQRDVVLSLIDDDRYTEAFFVINELIFKMPNKFYNPTSTYYNNVTGYESYYNVLLIEDPPETNTLYEDFVQQAQVRRALHVGGNCFNGREEVVTHMIDDILKSAKPYMSVLMENYKVLVYTGHLDLVVPYPATAKFLSKISWSGAEALAAAPRKIWRPPFGPGSNDSESKRIVYGYTRRVEKFREVTIRNAGHFAPFDQPEVSLDMMTRFIFDLPFTDDEATSSEPNMS
ncbi:venom serine carboxypeptidase-like isoform X2 [Amblyomma americanum]